jgi:hypothetical protein
MVGVSCRASAAWRSITCTVRKQNPSSSVTRPRDSIQPGETMFEVTPAPFRSRASETARLWRAASVALYSGWLAIGCCDSPPPI